MAKNVVDRERKNKMKETKIICKHCGKDTGKIVESYEYCRPLAYDVWCPFCKGVVLPALDIDKI